MEKRKIQWTVSSIIVLFIFCICSSSIAAEKIVVVPLGGAIGNATEKDVIQGKTFSSKNGKGLIGSLVLNPMTNPYKNTIGMRFYLIQNGSFTMGSLDTEPGHLSNEILHKVTLTKPFYIQVTEVTNKDWNTVISSKGRGVNPSIYSGDDHPVEMVNWYEAASFTNWLSYDEGFIPCYNGVGTCTGTLGVNFTCSTVVMVPGCTGYRLPTEAQWEYAARAGSDTAYANPINFNAADTETDIGFNENLHAMGWYTYNELMENALSVPAYDAGTKPVAKKAPNYWGLYDMHGNVSEWCQDYMGSYNTVDTVDPQGPNTGSNRIARGGGHSSQAYIARSAHRGSRSPNTRDNSVGFRLILPQE